ncbi:DUF2779 domain-containing protein [Spiroplasma endosymbiont of Labia minor]|uniref:DUF2779 domain-containing protein n=1 Tax=Spiroplasma endosymbiont of Labia minor TaxID=3066305 RepID=UPI0030CFD009
MLKNKISKENFKRAYASCFKLAFLMNSEENFNKVIKWTIDKQITTIDKKIEHDIKSENFNSNEPSIDLFNTYLNIELQKHKELLDEDQYMSDEEIENFTNDFKKNWFDTDIDFDVENSTAESIIDGNAVGAKAREYFDLISFRNKTKTKTLENFSFKKALSETNKLIYSKEIFNYEFLYEAAFMWDAENLRTQCDILKIKKNFHVELYEVKATTTAKTEHLFDILYQKYILEKNGFIVDNVFLLNINSKYELGNNVLVDKSFGDIAKDEYNYFLQSKNNCIEYNSFKNNLDEILEKTDNLVKSDLNLELFFKFDDFSSKSKAKNKTTLVFEKLTTFFDFECTVEELLIELDNYLSLSDEKILTDFKFGYCKCKKNLNSIKKINVTRDKFDKDNNQIVCTHFVEWFDKNEFSVFDIGLKKTNALNLAKNVSSFYLKKINENNIMLPLNKNGKTIYDYPDSYHALSVTLKYIMQNNISSIEIINKKMLKNLNSFSELFLKYPVYHYDFETMKTAIPIFENTCSYQQIPFQYSLDVMTDESWIEKINNNNNLDFMPHYEHISEIDIEKNNFDPRFSFVKNFIKNCFRHGPGTYVSYNESFEKSVLKRLAITYPSLKEPIYFIIQNTIDLMKFFSGITLKNPLILSNKDSITLNKYSIYHPNFRGSYSIKTTQPVLYPKLSYSDLIINKGDKTSYIYRMIATKTSPFFEQYKDKFRYDMLVYCNRDTMAMVVLLYEILKIIREANDESKN